VRISPQIESQGEVHCLRLHQMFWTRQTMLHLALVMIFTHHALRYAVAGMQPLPGGHLTLKTTGALCTRAKGGTQMTMTAMLSTRVGMDLAAPTEIRLTQTTGIGVVEVLLRTIDTRAMNAAGSDPGAAPARARLGIGAANWTDVAAAGAMCPGTGTMSARASGARAAATASGTVQTSGVAAAAGAMTRR
jgi:hypothetical protein